MTTLSTLNKFKKTVATTCLSYDAMFARMMDNAQIDAILIGDSLGMVVQGHAIQPCQLASMIWLIIRPICSVVISMR